MLPGRGGIDFYDDDDDNYEDVGNDNDHNGNDNSKKTSFKGVTNEVNNDNDSNTSDNNSKDNDGNDNVVGCPWHSAASSYESWSVSTDPTAEISPSLAACKLVLLYNFCLS